MKALGMAVAATLLLAGGCAHRGSSLPPAKDEPFRIGREDVLDIAVWRDGDLSRVLPVRPDGYIAMPMVGELKAEGKTPAELADEIKAKLTPYVQEPKVTVMVREVNSSRVFVTGEVARPGSYPLRGKVSLLQAVALAGGFSDFANTEGIVVIRQGNSYPVRYSDLISSDEDRSGAEALLVPGDTVVVP